MEARPFCQFCQFVSLAKSETPAEWSAPSNAIQIGVPARKHWAMDSGHSRTNAVPAGFCRHPSYDGARIDNRSQSLHSASAQNRLVRGAESLGLYCRSPWGDEDPSNGGGAETSS